MITLIPIEPLDDGHGALIVEAFGRFLIDGGGEPDGLGNGWGWGYSNGNGGGEEGAPGLLTGAWGYGRGYGDGDGDGDGKHSPLPDEWRVDTHAIPCKP